MGWLKLRYCFYFGYFLIILLFRLSSSVILVYCYCGIVALPSKRCWVVTPPFVFHLPAPVCALMKASASSTKELIEYLRRREYEVNAPFVIVSSNFFTITGSISNCFRLFPLALVVYTTM